MSENQGVPMQFYRRRVEEYTTELQHLRRRADQVSALRLITALLFLTALFFVDSHAFAAWGAVIVLFVVFVLLMRYHSGIGRQTEFKEALLKINRDEITCLKNEALPFEDGIEFNSVSHPYANDLDIFGHDSLFQHINRTGTFPGKKTLAATLQSLLSNEQILQNQEAISELAQKTGWRHDLLARAMLSGDSREAYEALITWSGYKEAGPGKLVRLLSFVLPVLTVSSILLYYFDVHRYFLLTSAGFFVLNLTVVMTQYSKIKKLLMQAGSINETIRQYSLMISHIEKEEFSAQRLQALKATLQFNGEAVSKQVKEFSSIFSDLSNINKSIGAFIMNGLFIHHLHVLHKLYVWKAKYALNIPVWLDVIGQIETLNSFAAFSYNNPEFIFPALNTGQQIKFTSLAHPLIRKLQRVDNSVEFEKGNFIILTGSNMSGKSTFLRTLGVNMVLTGVGAPVCASAASVHPLNVYVAMRLNDSLSSGDSYFLAEVKRLKQIMDALGTDSGFVLLDEILRGTNSDDKRAGTVAVIKKMVEKGATGVIATHDIEVCQVAAEFPHKLVNRCFEVETSSDELVFDYKLREGICKNRSASFLLKKMEVI